MSLLLTNTISKPNSKPQHKRSREELSNASEPEVERTTVLTKTDRAMLEDMHEQIKQLKKLDLLHDMIKDIAELKLAVDFTNNLIVDLKKENAILKTTVSTLQNTTEKLSNENKQMK